MRNALTCSLAVLALACSDVTAFPDSSDDAPPWVDARDGAGPDLLWPADAAQPLDAAWVGDWAAPVDALGPGARPDAATEVDAALEVDRGTEPDAALEADAEAPPEDDWGPCVVDGVPGRCVPVATCGPGAFPTPGFCPGDATIQCCTPGEAPDPAGDCDPATLRDPNGDRAEAPGQGGCPAGMAPIDADACVDVYEAALVEVGVGPWSPFHNPGQRPVRAVSMAGAVPQGYINADQAAAACANAGKRLCSDAEWLRACQGAAGRTYPYGGGRQPGACNDARARHPAVELFPDVANPFDHIQDACINQLPDSVARTGAHPDCVTPEGVFDLMGNLHEWTSAPSGTFRGGFYVDTVRNGEGCLYRTTAHNRQHWDYSTGFRCCADR